MRSSAVLILAALVTEATAYYNYTLPAGFNLGNVSSTQLEAWCQGERNSCPEICGGAASSNDCDPTTLDFDCVCSNGTAPNLLPYMNTIPFYVCEANFGQCIANNPNDLDAQDACKANATCGTLLATSSASSTTSTSLTTSAAAASATATAPTSSVATGSATGNTATSTPSKAAAAALQVSQEHATGFFAAALLAVFGLIM